MIRDEGRASIFEIPATSYFKSLSLLGSIACCRARPLSFRFGFHPEFRYRASDSFP